MTKHYESEIRRNRISNLVQDEPLKYDFEHPKKIAIALDLDYRTVQNDIKFLMEKHRQLIKEYNIYALAISYHEKHERLAELQKEAAKMVKESDGKNKIDAIHLEINIINNMYHLVSDGITPLAEEIEEKEAAEKEAAEKEAAEKDAIKLED